MCYDSDVRGSGNSFIVRFLSRVLCVSGFLLGEGVKIAYYDLNKVGMCLIFYKGFSDLGI